MDTEEVRVQTYMGEEEGQEGQEEEEGEEEVEKGTKKEEKEGACQTLELQAPLRPGVSEER